MQNKTSENYFTSFNWTNSGIDVIMDILVFEKNMFNNTYCRKSWLRDISVEYSISKKYMKISQHVSVFAVESHLFPRGSNWFPDLFPIVSWPRASFTKASQRSSIRAESFACPSKHSFTLPLTLLAMENSESYFCNLTSPTDFGGTKRGKKTSNIESIQILMAWTKTVEMFRVCPLDLCYNR